MPLQELDIWGMATRCPDKRLLGTDLGATVEGLEASGFWEVRAGETVENPELMHAVSAEALEDAGIAPKQLGGVLVMRSGFYRPFEGNWLSLGIAKALQCARPFCLDVKAPGCSSAAQGFDLAARLVSSQPADQPYCLVVGGGASGYGQRWYQDDPPADGGPQPLTGTLLGDGVYAAVLGPAGGKITIKSTALFLDQNFWNVDQYVGNDCERHSMNLDDSRRWNATAGGTTGLVMKEAVSKAGWDRKAPMFFVGTNSRMQSKRMLCQKRARETDDPRYELALQAQLRSMREIGHHFGGDTMKDLCTVRQAVELKPGDGILSMEAGDTFCYAAIVFVVRDMLARARQ